MTYELKDIAVQMAKVLFLDMRFLYFYDKDNKNSGIMIQNGDMFGSPFIARHRMIAGFIEEILSPEEIKEIYEEADDILGKGKEYETSHLTYIGKRRSEKFFHVTNRDLKACIEFINKYGRVQSKENGCRSAQIKYISGNIAGHFEISSEKHEEIKSISGCEDCPECCA